MAVKIGSARSSFGNTKPGDQAGGREVSTQTYYVSDKGWVMLRCEDEAKAERIAECMQLCCDTNLIGYDQSTRNSLYNALKDEGFDPRRLTKSVNTDCSALVRFCCAYAGIKLKNFTTADEASVLVASGMFDKYTDSEHCKKADYLRRGDILVTKTKGHTVVVLSNGSKVVSKVTSTAKNTVTVAEGTWNVRTGPATKYPSRALIKGGSTVEKVGTDASGWVQIKASNLTGWISPKAVKEA